MKYNVKKFIAVLWAAVFIVSLLMSSVSAAGPCTINMTAQFEDRPIAGIEKKIYRCGRLLETGFDLVGEFSDYPIETMPETTEAWNDLAVAFDGYVSAMGIEPTAVLTSDQNGEISFTDLEPGLYFVAGSVYNDNKGMIYTSAPFFVYVSAFEPTVDAALKVTGEVAPGYVIRKVIKIWDDLGDVESRPESILVILYADGVEYERVRLTAETDWRYWWVLPDKYSWSIFEVTPNGYVSTTDFEGITFTLTNTPVVPPPTPTPPPDLPQTGLTWWPIPVFFGLGVVAFALALKFRRCENDEKK